MKFARVCTAFNISQEVTWRIEKHIEACSSTLKNVLSRIHRRRATTQQGFAWATLMLEQDLQGTAKSEDSEI